MTRFSAGDPSSAPPREGPGGGAPLGLRGALPLVLLAVTLAVVAALTWAPLPVGVWHDDGVYMMVGKALGEGQGLRYVGVPGDPPAVKFPPAYPALLGVLWAGLGALVPVTLAAQFLNLAFLLGAGLLLARALRGGAGMGWWAAAGVAGAAFISADVWRMALIPLSEPLFLVLAAGAFAAWDGATRAGTRRGRIVLAALLTAAVLTRSSGVALVVGFAAALAWERRWKALLEVAVPPVLAALAWGGWAARRAEEIPEGLRDILGPYGGWLGGQLADAPGAFAAGLPAHAGGVVTRALALLLPGASGAWLWAAALPLGALGLLGARSLSRRLPPLPWAAAAYLGMLLVWPFVDRRLVAPLHPWLVVLVAAGALEGLRWARASGDDGGRPRGAHVRRAAGWTAVAVGTAWAAGLVGVSGVRAAEGWAAAPYRLRAERLATAVAAMERTVPPGAVVGAPEFWAALPLHGAWQGAPSARFTLRAADPGTPVWGTPSQQIELWWSVGADHLLLEQGGRIHGDALNLMEETCPGAVGILARFPPQMLVRLEWSEACVSALGLADR